MSKTKVVALNARVSTSGKDQDPETRLVPLREFVVAQGWEVNGEYVDYARATDLASRTAWRQLLEDASKRRFDLLLVWRMDRGFRSVLDAATTLERLGTWGVGLWPYSEPWLDTTSPLRRGPLLHHGGIRAARKRHPARAGDGWRGQGPQTRPSNRSPNGTGIGGASPAVLEQFWSGFVVEIFRGGRRLRSWGSGTRP